MNFVMKAALGGEWPTGLEVDLTALQCKGLEKKKGSPAAGAAAWL